MVAAVRDNTGTTAGLGRIVRSTVYAVVGGQEAPQDICLCIAIAVDIASLVAMPVSSSPGLAPPHGHHSHVCLLASFAVLEDPISMRARKFDAMLDRAVVAAVVAAILTAGESKVEWLGRLHGSSEESRVCHPPPDFARVSVAVTMIQSHGDGQIVLVVVMVVVVVVAVMLRAVDTKDDRLCLLVVVFFFPLQASQE
jgi:hypothetical protein